MLTLIASARLHGLDPEAYLRDVFRVLPYWPRDRFLELCPHEVVLNVAALATGTARHQDGDPGAVHRTLTGEALLPWQLAKA